MPRESRPSPSCARRTRGASPNRALDGNRRRQFVLHLDEQASDCWNSPRKAFDHFGGGGNGIPCGKSRTCCECSLTTGMVTVEKMNTREDAVGVSVHNVP